jgi:tetratricopeptide (TPR) repeat protein
VLLEAERFTASTTFESEAELQAALHERFSGPIGEGPSLASTPLERAQDLAYRAADARGRRRIQLARKALELSADCADALVLLAEDASDPVRAHDLYARAVAAAERALGPAIFAEEAGQFWTMVRTRPYMRARFGLAQSLEALGRPDEAIAHYRDLIRLNENDNLGVRDTLVATLLRLNRNDDAGELLAQFEADATALWTYASALCAFRREGNSPAARRRLDAAIRANRRAPAYLQRKRTWPGPAPGSYALGSEEEAAIVESVLGELWRGTPEAEGWLARHAPAGQGGRSGTSGKRRRR